MTNEPVWAIGTGRTATPEQAQEVNAHIKAHLANRWGQDAVHVQYGGSVTAQNAHALFEQPDIDGALVGGASLRSAEFASIVAAAASTRAAA
jgi:triosephosphate isomerase